MPAARRAVQSMALNRGAFESHCYGPPPMSLRTPLYLAALLASCSHAPAAKAPAAAAAAAQDNAPGWIERSNQDAQLLLDVGAKFRPEGAARNGITGIDDQITDFTPGHRERFRAATRTAMTELQGRAPREQDPLVA